MVVESIATKFILKVECMISPLNSLAGDQLANSVLDKFGHKTLTTNLKCIKLTPHLVDLTIP